MLIEKRIICFIATAAFGTPLAEEIEVLRRFRDYLLGNNWGRSLVEFYYEHSPPLAAYISQREWAQALVRSSLLPLLWFEGRRGRRGRRRRRIRREVEIEAKYTYCAFGTLIEGDNNNPYGFTGERQFGEADGLIFLRARYYDQSTGRFISRDPILLSMVDDYGSFWFLPYLVSQPQRLHPYVYAANNPVNRIDPTGLRDEAYNRCIRRARAWYRLCRAGARLIRITGVGCFKVCKPAIVWSGYLKCLKTCLANIDKTAREAEIICKIAYEFELSLCRADREARKEVCN